MTLEEQRAQLDELIGEDGDRPVSQETLEQLDSEDLGALIEAAQQSKDDEGVDDKEPKEEPEVTTSKPSKVGLREDIRAQLRVAQEAKPEPTDDPAIEFDQQAWSELMVKDPAAGVKMLAEFQLQTKEPDKKLKDTLRRVEAMEQNLRVSTASQFIKSNPDYPHQDQDVNAFMESALTRLGLPYTASNLEEVWNMAKKEGYVTGLSVEDKPAKVAKSSETPTKTAAAKPTKPVRVPPRAKGRETGAITGDEGSNPLLAKLVKMAESDEDFDVTMEKLRQAGLTSEGSLSKLTGMIQ